MEEGRKVIMFILMAPGKVASMPASQHNILMRWSTNHQYGASSRLWGVYQGIMQNIRQLSGYSANSIFLVVDDTTTVDESFVKASAYARDNGLNLVNHDSLVERDELYDIFILFEPELFSSLKRPRGREDDDDAKRMRARAQLQALQF